jgi:hypothetical protein
MDRAGACPGGHGRELRVTGSHRLLPLAGAGSSAARKAVPRRRIRLLVAATITYNLGEAAAVA